MCDDKKQRRGEKKEECRYQHARENTFIELDFVSINIQPMNWNCNEWNAFTVLWHRSGIPINE